MFHTECCFPDPEFSFLAFKAKWVCGYFGLSSRTLHLCTRQRRLTFFKINSFTLWGVLAKTKRFNFRISSPWSIYIRFHRIRSYSQFPLRDAPTVCNYGLMEVFLLINTVLQVQKKWNWSFKPNRCITSLCRDRRKDRLRSKPSEVRNL